jgi:DNA-binding NtrC family response regulator
MAPESAEGAPCWVRNACPQWCRAECEAVLGPGVTRQAAAPPRRVLVVDDEPLLRWAACLSLRREGHEVRLAGSQDEAFDIIMEPAALDLAIVDWRLPQGDGLDIARLLRRLQPACVVCVVSDGVTWSLEQTARSLGAICHTKPIDAVALVNALERPPRPWLPGVEKSASR